MLSKLANRVRAGQGLWRPVKMVARGVLSLHLPVLGPTRSAFRVAYRLHVGIAELLRWAVRFAWYEPLFRSQCASIGPGFRMEQLPYIQGSGRIVIGRDVRLSGKPNIHFSGRFGRTPELIIGSGTFIGHACAFHIGQSIHIGRHCLLAGGTQIFDLDGHPLDAAARRAGRPSPPDAIQAVEIGDDVWIGAGALILKGVTIGPRSVVAARAVVTHDVPADVVVGGNPARVLRGLAPADPTERDALLASTDWDSSALEAVP
jgi:acetyltransferase-like isoleucine patch superfamily enzyme